MDADPLPPVLTPDDVASFLKVCVETIYRMAASGRLRATRIGGRMRFKREDVMALLEEAK